MTKGERIAYHSIIVQTVEFALPKLDVIFQDIDILSTKINANDLIKANLLYGEETNVDNLMISIKFYSNFVVASEPIIFNYL